MMQFDPRTVARDIPGVFDEIFPQLTPGIVAHFNSSADALKVSPISMEALSQSMLQRAMLFELANVVAESLIRGVVDFDWPASIEEAIQRQRAYFDAKAPEQLTAHDQSLAERVARNLAESVTAIGHASGHAIAIRPKIPGLEWIASGSGDFSCGRTLIEVKCTAKRFSSADYRQVAIYWLLSYAASIEGHGTEWQDFVLLNPRHGTKVAMSFEEFLSVVSSGRTKVDILQLFQSLVGSRSSH